MSLDNLEINFPVWLTSQEANLLLRDICINESINLGIPLSVIEVSDDDHRMYQKIKIKLNSIIPQSSCDTPTKDYVDRVNKECS